MIRLIVDSSADFSKEELEEKGLIMVPLTITVNDKNTYRDEIDLSRADLYKMLTSDNNRVKTSQPSPQDFLDKFEEAKEAGDEVLCITLSSALSGTYQSAVLAKSMAEYDKIYIVDTLTATVAIRVLTGYAQKLIAENYGAEEIAAKLEEMKSKVKINVVVDTLKYLYLGGRVSKTTAIVADAVTIKPGIFVTTDGKVSVGSKYLGIRRAISSLTKLMKGMETNPDFPLYIIYSADTANALELQKSLENAGVHTDGMYEIGATIGVHTGPGVFGVVYTEK